MTFAPRFFTSDKRLTPNFVGYLSANPLTSDSLPTFRQLFCRIAGSLSEIPPTSNKFPVNHRAKPLSEAGNGGVSI